MTENDPRPDPRLHGAIVVNLKRGPACRRPLDPATRQRWVSQGVVFYLCGECRERAQSDHVFVDRIFHALADWLEMDAVLAKYRSDHADVL